MASGSYGSTSESSKGHNKQHGRVIGNEDSHNHSHDNNNHSQNDHNSRTHQSGNHGHHRGNDDDGDSSSLNSEEIDNLRRDYERQPLLSPDDPRVSPLNIRRVKLLRFFLHLLLIFNLVWLVLSLISYFVSVPGFDSHGKSYLEFSFIFASLYVNFLSYMFFLTPSDLHIDKGLNFVSLGLLLFDLLVVLVFPYQRSQLGISEYITLVFSIFSVGLNLVSNRYVLKAKENEEVRLTGRVETRKTVKEHFFIGLEFFLKGVLILYVIAISLNIFLKAVDSAVAKPWGKLVPAGGELYRIHLYCQGDVHGNSSSSASAVPGEGKGHQPVILLESGHESSEEFASWVQELYQLNRIQKYCIYDRPGFGYSDSVPSPYSLGINSDILSSVLLRENIKGPFLVVGHGIGGLYGRVFATRHISDIHSVMLVDAWSEELLLKNPFRNSNNKDRNLPVGVHRLNRRTGFKLWLKGIFSSVNLISYYNLVVHRFRSSERIFGRDMYRQGKYLRVRLQEQVAAELLSHNEILLSEHTLKDADKQVSVVSSKFAIRRSLNWGNWQRDLTRVSSNAHNEWVLAEAGHNVWCYNDGKRQLQKLLLRMVGEDDQL